MIINISRTQEVIIEFKCKCGLIYPLSLEEIDANLGFPFCFSCEEQVFQYDKIYLSGVKDENCQIHQTN